MTFASNLTVGDFLCVRRNGYRPLGQVMGACAYQIGYRARAYTGATGWPGYPGAGYFELGAPTRAWNEARATALEDVRRQARDLGADAVVGLQIRSRLRGGPVGTVEIVAVGTGVATDDGDASAPVLSTLDGGELDLLRRNGFTPAGILAATSVTQSFAVTGRRTSSRAADAGSTASCSISLARPLPPDETFSHTSRSNAAGCARTVSSAFATCRRSSARNTRLSTSS